MRARRHRAIQPVSIDRRDLDMLAHVGEFWLERVGYGRPGVESAVARAYAALTAPGEVDEAFCQWSERVGLFTARMRDVRSTLGLAGGTGEG